ncbi:MAG: EF-hand domain-containing protein, partial [Planctomycetota bacterium]
MRADIRSLRIALLLIGALSAAGAAGESKGSPADGIAKLFDEIDEDGDGRVAIAEFSRALGMDLKGTDLRARMLVASLDANADQQISRKEADDGAARMVAMSVSRLMALDVDGDEALSRQEYALGVPDPKGKPGDDGLTERQRDGFEHLDAGGDGKVTRAEVEVHAREQAASTLKEMRVAGRCLAVADQDRDGRISKEEFVRIAGETSADQFAALNPGSAGLGRRELLRWVTTQTKEERAKLLTRLDVQESRLEMRAAAAA